MGKFVFQMQQLLNIKRQLQKSKENELSIALKRIEDEENNLKNVTNAVESHMDGMKNKMLTGVSVNVLKQYGEYLSVLQLNVKKQKKVVNDVKSIADRIREELIEVSKEKKVLEILREKKFEEYKIEEQKKEELEVGEIVSYKYIKQKEGEADGTGSRNN